VSGFEVGSELETLSVTPDRYVTVRYAGASGDFNPIHIDEAFAQSVGLPGRILHGLYTMALVARAQSEAAGGPEKLKRLDAQFRGMGRPEHEITISSKVTEIRDGRAIVAATATQGGKAIIRGATAEIEL
jgi:acyl dehydratase